MAGTVGSAGNPNTPSPLTDQTQVQKTQPGAGSQKVAPANVPNQLNSLSPNNTSQKPIGERSSTPVDGKQTPGLSQPSEEKDLPALEQERENMLKEAGELMQKNEELTVLGFALRSLKPANYEEKLTPPPGLKVTLQMAPDAPVYTIEPPDEAFKKLPKEQKDQMKEMAYKLLMNHAIKSSNGVNPGANKKRIDELREKLEKNGEEIGKKNGDNNWRERLKKLEHRPAHIVINDYDGAIPSAREPKQKEKPKPQPKITVTAEPTPPVGTGDE